MPWSLSFHKAYSFGLCLVHTLSKNLTKMRVCHTQISQEMILYPGLSFTVLPLLISALVRLTLPRPPVLQVLLLLFSVDLPLCAKLQLETYKCTSLLLLPLTMHSWICACVSNMVSSTNYQFSPQSIIWKPKLI